MREGKRNLDKMPEAELNEQEFSGSVSMINRLATFIQAATEELEEANEQLRLAAIIDGLTQIYNRREIQRRIIEEADAANAVFSENNPEKAVKPNCLIMIDIDDFKTINDEFGHQKGDEVLQKLAEMYRTAVWDDGAERNS